MPLQNHVVLPSLESQKYCNEEGSNNRMEENSIQEREKLVQGT